MVQTTVCDFSEREWCLMTHEVKVEEWNRSNDCCLYWAPSHWWLCTILGCMLSTLCDAICSCHKSQLYLYLNFTYMVTIGTCCQQLEMANSLLEGYQSLFRLILWGPRVFGKIVRCNAFTSWSISVCNKMLYKMFWHTDSLALPSH